MRTITFALAPLALLAVACSASVESDPTAATSEAIIPIWLPSCDTEALSTPSVGTAINEQIGNCAWSNEASSPGASYGGQWCSSTYVIEVDKLSKAEAFKVFGGPTGYPGTSAVCGATHSALTVWAHSATTSDPSGRSLRLLIELGRGGMGVVYLALAEGPGGFAKLKMVKRLRPDLAGEP